MRRVRRLVRRKRRIPGVHPRQRSTTRQQVSYHAEASHCGPAALGASAAHAHGCRGGVQTTPALPPGKSGAPPGGSRECCAQRGSVCSAVRRLRGWDARAQQLRTLTGMGGWRKWAQRFKSKS